MGESSQYSKSLLDGSKFSITWELVPGRGAHEISQSNAIANAQKAVNLGKVDTLTITDNPGGNPACSAAMFAEEIRRLGIEPLVHLTCKDKNRNELEGLLWGLERAGVRNLLVMTGDYPRAGDLGGAKPVFDLDPVILLGLVERLNQGMEVLSQKGSTRLNPTHFFAGAVASPFKALEAEQMGQYFKLKKKLEAGAQFIVSQIGFDARKFHELLLVVKLLGYPNIPLVGNIYLLPLGAARLMHNNGLPGCVVTDKLLQQIEAEAASRDKGKGRRLERAAKMYALLRGMGFAGAHISGHAMTYEDLELVLDRGEELSPNWREFVHEFDYPLKGGWYYFERDSSTGVNSEVVTNREHRAKASIGYRAMKTGHRMMFEPTGLLFGPMQRIAMAVDGSRLETPFTKFEYAFKGFVSDCLQCGDCVLPELAYLCPQSQCAKNQRNGPCGGSRDGWCEKYPNERECFYVRVYERLKSQGEEESLTTTIPPVNYELQRTSSWVNFFLGRDHSAERLGIPKIERNKE